MNQKELDNNVDKIHFLTDKINLLESKTKQFPDDISIKIHLVETILEYEDLSKITVRLLDEFLETERTVTNVFNFQYRRLRKRLTA